jgi:hypothetical protein
MGSGQSIPETLDKDTAKQLAGDLFDELLFDTKARDGVVNRYDFVAASITDVFSLDSDGDGEPSVLFMARAGSTHEVCTLGLLAGQNYGQARRLPLRIPIRHLYNTLGMLKFAQRCRDQFNSTSMASAEGSNLSFAKSDYSRYLRQNYLELMSSLGERVLPNTAASIRGLDELIATVEQHELIVEKLRSARESVRAGHVMFDDLAELYVPGTKVFSRGLAAPGLDTGSEIVWCRYEEGKTMFGTKRNLVMLLEVWISVGGHFTPVQFLDRMHQFEGRRSISELFFDPVTQATQDRTRRQAALATRGKLYQQLATGQHFVEYNHNR